MAFELARDCFVSQQEAIEFYFPTCAHAEVSTMSIKVLRRVKRRKGERNIKFGRNDLAFPIERLTRIDYANILASIETDFVL